MGKWNVLFIILLELFSEATIAAIDNDSFSSKLSYETIATDKNSNKAKDYSLVKNIREQLVNDNYLSKSGKNVQIIVVGKEVTLKGTVSSEGERTRIINLATRVSENHQIRNQMEVSNE